MCLRFHRSLVCPWEGRSLVGARDSCCLRGLYWHRVQPAVSLCGRGILITPLRVKRQAGKNARQPRTGSSKRFEGHAKNGFLEPLKDRAAIVARSVGTIRNSRRSSSGVEEHYGITRFSRSQKCPS